MRWVWLTLAACNYDPSRVIVDTVEPADAFDLRDCPATYTLVLPGELSRYRIIENGAKAWEHSDDCNDDLVGATHLVAIDTQTELDQIEAELTDTGSLSNNKAWLGGVQPRMQGSAGAGWLSITGGAMIATAWNPGEPNDGGGDLVEDSQENLLGFERGRDGLIDFNNGDEMGGMCECDGKRIDPTAAAAIDVLRQ